MSVRQVLTVVALRFKLEWRGLGIARERALGIGVMTLLMMMGSSVLAVGVYATLRGLSAVEPSSAIAVVAVWSSLLGLAALLGPVLSRAAVAESHDYAQLVHLPVSPGTLAIASVIANLLQPLVITQLPIFVAASFAVSRSPVAVPFAAAGFGITYAAILVAAQIGSLASHALARSRRFRDASLFVAIAGGFLIGLLPLMFILHPGLWHRAFSFVMRSGATTWLPFAYGARAAVHAGQGEMGNFLVLSAAGGVAILLGIAIATRLVKAIHGGELDLGTVSRAASRRSLLRLPGIVGAVVEKDVRTLWRDPALRAGLFTGLFGPILFLYLMTRQGRSSASGYTVMILALFVGASGLGGGAFGMERGSIGQLLSFPAARWKILVAKNVSVSIFKVPGLVTLAVAAIFLAPATLWPAVAVVALVALMMAAAIDGYVSIRFPWTPPRPGGGPGAYSSSSAQGMSRFLVTFGSFFAVVACAAPFVFLTWLPYLLSRPALGFVTLPLALAGALAVYALLVHGAESLLLRREPELLERVSHDVRTAG